MAYWTIHEEPSAEKYPSGKPKRRFYATEYGDFEESLRKIGPVRSRIKAIGMIARIKPKPSWQETITDLRASAMAAVREGQT